jgi:excisionase family DNA binding protein
MPLTLGQAAQETGKSKPTILKAIRSGRLSATKDGIEWRIEPSELFRVYPKSKPLDDVSDEKVNPPVNPVELAVLRARLDAAEKQIEDLKEDRDHWRQQANRLLGSPKPALTSTTQSLWQRLFGKS